SDMDYPGPQQRGAERRHRPGSVRFAGEQRLGGQDHSLDHARHHARPQSSRDHGEYASHRAAGHLQSSASSASSSSASFAASASAELASSTTGGATMGVVGAVGAVGASLTPKPAG